MRPQSLFLAFFAGFISFAAAIPIGGSGANIKTRENSIDDEIVGTSTLHGLIPPEPADPAPPKA